MKSIIVPAQITTVEDKIAGNLSFTQMMLLIAPVAMTGLLFVLLPPFVHVNLAKLMIGGCLFLICAALAVRVKGELLLHLIVTRVRYNIRPKYYVYDKNDEYLRYEPTKQPVLKTTEVTIPEAVDTYIAQLIGTPERVWLETVIKDPRARFQMIVKKGGLHVRINEIKEESF